MSLKAIVSALVALVLLGALAIYLSRGGSGPVASPAPLMEFDPGAVTSIEVTNADGRTHRVERSREGEWRYIWRDSKGRVVVWPALVPQEALQAIARLNGLERAFGRPPGWTSISNVTLTLRDGAKHTIEVLPGALGGFTTVRTVGEDVGEGRMETRIIDALTNPGPSGWRSPQAAPGVRDASRLTISDRSGSISLARLDGQWMMLRPVSARTDPAAVTTLLGALSTAAVTRFEDRPPASMTSTGLDSPAMIITWEVDERTPDASGGVRVQTHSGMLRVGGPADASGSQRFASADEAGATLMVIPASTLTSISTAARNYLAPTVTGVLPADVFLLTINDAADSATTRAYRRSMGAWVVQQTDGGTAPADADAVDELLGFIAERPGEAEPAAGMGDLRDVARLDLFDLDGDPLEVITVGYNADGVLAFRVKNHVVLFGGLEAPGLLNLPSFASLAPLPDAPPTPTFPEGAPVGK